MHGTTAAITIEGTDVEGVTPWPQVTNHHTVLISAHSCLLTSAVWSDIADVVGQEIPARRKGRGCPGQHDSRGVEDRFCDTQGDWSTGCHCRSMERVI